jgi:large subunit ribosomal protein L17
MYKRIKTKKLGRTMAHRKALIKNQIRSLVHSGSIKTSTAKAKVVKGELESLMHKVKNAKDGDLNLRRELQVILGDKELVKKFVEFSKKENSKVVVRKIGFREGDNSEVSQIVIDGLKVKKVKKVEKKKDDVEEEKEVESKKLERKNLLNVGSKKSVSKKVGAVNKERAKSRSGL